MKAATGTHRGLRCLGVWLGVTVAVVVVILVVRAELAAALGDDWTGLAFDGLLVRGTAVVAAGAGAWVWLVTTITVVEAAGGLERPTLASGPVRRIVLAACGVALVSGAVAAPAGATPGQADRADTPASVRGRLLGGLPLPDRASIHHSPAQPGTSAPTTTPTDPVAHQEPAQADSVVVLAGGSLWSIAAATLPPGSTAEQVDRRWREIYAANRAAIGANPDLIQPGLRLTLPSA